MIRLATAHAKARMSRNVTADDAYAAIELIQYAYFKKVLEKEKRNKRPRESDEEEEDDSDDNDSERISQRSRRTVRNRMWNQLKLFALLHIFNYLIPQRARQDHASDNEAESVRGSQVGTQSSQINATDTISERMDVDDTAASTISEERYALDKN